METLAIHGGTPAITYSLPTVNDSSGRDFGLEEVIELVDALKRGNLGFISGTKIQQLQTMWAEKYDAGVAVCVSSGTAALHTALNFLGLTSEDEVLIPAITDIGTVLGAMLQGAVPVFVDCDPITQNMDPLDIERHITPRTKAIMPVHLYGYPCDMDSIVAIARKHGLYIVEDCCQAHTTRYKGRLVGTFGDVACFSFQQSKHMTTGDGGMVMAKQDLLCGRKLVMCHDKAWPREKYREHLWLAPNYHFTDLQAAVGIAQFRKLDTMVENRRRSALHLSQLLKQLDGTIPQGDTEMGYHTFFEYPLPLDMSRFTADLSTLASAITAEGVACSPSYIPKPIYAYDVVEDVYHYPLNSCPRAVEACQRMLYIPWTEKTTIQHAEDIFHAIQKVLTYYHK